MSDNFTSSVMIFEICVFVSSSSKNYVNRKWQKSQSSNQMMMVMHDQRIIMILSAFGKIGSFQIYVKRLTRVCLIWHTFDYEADFKSFLSYFLLHFVFQFPFSSVKRLHYLTFSRSNSLLLEWDLLNKKIHAQ